MRKTTSGRFAAAALLAAGALLASFAAPAASARTAPESPPTAPSTQAPTASASASTPATAPTSASASNGPRTTADVPTSQAAPFVDDNVLFEQKTNGYACFRIPAIVRAGNGMVLAFAEGRVADCGDDGDIDVVLRRSTDGVLGSGPARR
ncbi:hypothetical protein EV652_101499 [Kribbella steppae]|uniref:Uncharacterized protein n=1 Tax=Kribbella steppae TaxID=2512223 RepID=A0A4R2HZS9_9ACTN|nr:sialidase family protein [Kribbella steppae]TCO35615.1 hypothetical protein EV652_101499 [Kribbella steppae]